MSIGLIALLDEVAALARMAAASLDDVATQAAQAGTKAAGVVIDDAAVTPRYVTGLAAEREVPIIARIALGSLRNKLLILLPTAMALSALLPAAITPLLMLGGLYLAYEGAEKIFGLLFPHAAHEHEAGIDSIDPDAKTLEDAKVASAIKTDFILSAEIMAITLGAVEKQSLAMQALVLAGVGIGITLAVYGVVALIVKADDAGLYLARSSRPAPLGPLIRGLGRGMVRAMGPLMSLLSGIGTAAMIWVGGGILIHGLAHFGLHGPETLLHGAAGWGGKVLTPAPGLGAALAEAGAAGLFGLVVGGVLIPVVGYGLAPLWHGARRLFRTG